MKFDEAERQKAYAAEKQISAVRALVIIFSGSTFFFIDNPYIRRELAYVLIAATWLYGGFVLYYKPYKKFPVFLASWFTYISDAFFTTIWVYATGGFYSPYYVIYFASIIAVAFRFDLSTTIVTSLVYIVAYLFLLVAIGHLHGNESTALIRSGFIFIIGILTYQITRETLFQTQQRLKYERLVIETQELQKKQDEDNEQLEALNKTLQLRNNIFNHAEENAMIGSFAWNLATDEMNCSENLLRMLQADTAHAVIRPEAYLQFVHPDDREAARESLEEIKRTSNVRTSLQRVVTGMQELRYFRFSAKIAGEEAQRFMIGTMQDVTDDVMLSEALQNKNQELERSNAELESFSYIASHDLQEPVRKIHTFSELILERDGGNLSASTREHLNRISSAASRMQFLIKAFLNYSHINRSDIVFEKVDLEKVMNEVLLNLKETIEEKRAVIKTEDLPVINGVAFHMQQLFMNLVSNALKYSKETETPQIVIHAGQVPGREIDRLLPSVKPYYWRITVSDNGIGFDQQYAEKIFEVFQRLHSKDKYAGTGIGLAICKKIVQTHQGYIHASGQPGAGSVFTIYLPV